MRKRQRPLGKNTQRIWVSEGPALLNQARGQVHGYAEEQEIQGTELHSSIMHLRGLVGQWACEQLASWGA